VLFSFCSGCLPQAGPVHFQAAKFQKETSMQKAHLHEAIFLVNQGIDQTVRGLIRLRKATGIADEIYAGTVATLEHARAQVNVQFLAEMEQAERRDAARYAPDRPTYVDRHESANRDSAAATTT
jgi:hypothetical protein